MRQRWRLILGSLLAASFAGLLVAVLVRGRLAQRGEPIRLGLLHSKSGPLRISEESLLLAEILAIEEINAAGGVADREVVYSAPDCQSDPTVSATEARRLGVDEKAAALFGTWTSECRKAVVPVVAEQSSLLFFPGNFEGIEESPRVVYTGGAANQSIPPAVRWAFDSLEARKFFVVGMEEVWSRGSSEIAKDAVRAAGAEVVGEHYVPGAAADPARIVEAIGQAKPDVVLNFLYGEINPPFYAAMRKAGLGSDKLPVIAFGFSEDESRQFAPADVIGQYAAWNYFQSVPRQRNLDFVKKFRARWGQERLVGDSMVAAYNSIKFWAMAVAEVGGPDVGAVLDNLDRQSMDAPDGIITIDSDSRAAWRPFHLGRFGPDGQFQIIHSILKPIRPVIYVGTRSEEQWRAFLGDLKARWRGRWSAGASELAPAAARR